MKKIMKWISVLTLLLMILSCKNNNKVDYFPTEEWKTSTPEAQGIDSEQLLKAIKPLAQNKVANIHSLLIIRNGYIVAEYYSPLHNEETLHNLHSATKSFTSTLVGIAVNQKKLKVSDKVLSFFPDREFQNMNDWKEEMTVQDVLTMGSGLDWGEWFFDMGKENPLNEAFASKDWVQYILDRKIITKPGTQFNYNTGNSHILSAIVSKTSGQQGRAFAEENLFTPLGIDNYNWTEDKFGNLAGGIGLELSPRSMAKLGQLYLNQGLWEGKRLLSKKWIKEASANYYPEGEIPYGYQFWLEEYSYNARGYGNQVISVYPEANVIFVSTGDFNYFQKEQGYKAWANFNGEVWKAINPQKTLPENPLAYKSLTDTLASLGKERSFVAEAPSSIKNIVGKTIYFDKNQFQVTSFTVLKIDENEIEVEISVLNPKDQTEKTAIFSAGSDNTYIDNGYRGYPLSIESFMPIPTVQYSNHNERSLFMKGKFIDDQSMTLHYMIPGSVVSGYATLEITEEGPRLWVSKGPGMRLRINGRIE